MKDYYIYNRFQALFYINAGLTVLEIGVGSKGDIFHRFERNAESERVFAVWREGAPERKGDMNGKDRSDNSCV